MWQEDFGIGIEVRRERQPTIMMWDECLTG
jgi:hypothetical protein